MSFFRLFQHSTVTSTICLCATSKQKRFITFPILLIKQLNVLHKQINKFSCAKYLLCTNFVQQSHAISVTSLYHYRLVHRSQIWLDEFNLLISQRATLTNLRPGYETKHAVNTNQTMPFICFHNGPIEIVKVFIHTLSVPDVYLFIIKLIVLKVELFII